MGFLKVYATSFITFFVIDLFWLGVVASKLYKKHLGFIMSASPNWAAAIAFYLLYIAGLVFFVINPALEKKSASYALLAGMFFGLVSYATYDLTNYATLKDWPVLITVIDLIWGSTLGAVVSYVAYQIVTKMNWS
jgi:uncharacterized membrane protein